jgi:hypothetical protein
VPGLPLLPALRVDRNTPVQHVQRAFLEAPQGLFLYVRYDLGSHRRELDLQPTFSGQRLSLFVPA